MESLLSVAFDNISSNDPTRISKGLRQIEGLLAQICLSSNSINNSISTKPPTKHHNRSNSLIDPTTSSPPPQKSLHDLPHDPAFTTFFHLQQNFQYNAATRLLRTLEHLLGHHSTPSTDALLTQTLTTLQALLLLHPPSRHLLASPAAMTLLLDLLDAGVRAGIQSAALLALVAALLRCPRNARAFERADGLGTVTSLFKSAGAPTELKMRLLEFLYFYLMPEEAGDAVLGAAAAGHAGGGGASGGSGKSDRSAGSGKSSGSGKSVGSVEAARESRTVKEKQRLLGRYLGGVEDLVQDLRESAPFGVTLPG